MVGGSQWAFSHRSGFHYQAKSEWKEAHVFLLLYVRTGSFASVCDLRYMSRPDFVLNQTKVSCSLWPTKGPKALLGICGI